MPVTRQTLGANTVMITVAADTSTVGQYVLDSYTTLLTQVKTEITSKGWTLHDEIVLPGGSHIHTLVFEALNADTVTHKFMIMRWDTIKQEIYISTCEYWNATTHVPVNESYTYGDSTPIPYRQDAYDLVIFVSQYWCILQAFHINEPSQWAGVIEVDREDSVDINSVTSYTWSPYNVGTTVPCWGYISSNLWMQGFTTSTAAASFDGGQTMDSYSTSYHRSVICFPRTKSGYTWQNAADYQSVSTEFFTTPNPMDTLGQPRSFRGNLPVNVFLSNAFEQGRTNIWDGTKKLVYTMKVIEGSGQSTFNNRGAIMGIKITKPIGTLMNKVNLPINGKFYYDAAGSTTPHFVLNTHGISLDSRSNVTTTRDILLNKQVISSMGSFSTPIVVGKYVYALSGSTLFKMDMSTGTLMGTTGKTQVATGVYTPVYDGNRYIYFTNGSNSAYRFDTRADAIVNTKSLANSYGVGNIVVTKEYLVVADVAGPTANLSAKIKTLALSDFTTTTSPTNFTPAANYVSGMLLERDREGSILIFGGYTCVSLHSSYNSPYSINTSEDYRWFSAKLQYTSGALATATSAIAHTSNYSSTYGVQDAWSYYAWAPVFGIVDAGLDQSGNNRFILVNNTSCSAQGSYYTFKVWEITSNMGANTYSITDRISLSDVVAHAGATNTGNNASTGVGYYVSQNDNAARMQSRLTIAKHCGNYIISRGSDCYGGAAKYLVINDRFDISPVTTTPTSFTDNTNYGKIYADGFRIYGTMSSTNSDTMHILNNVYTHNLSIIGNVITQCGQVLIPA
jgi:hypothetical protein